MRTRLFMKVLASAAAALSLAAPSASAYPDLAQGAGAVGAPAFWQAGFLGGTGSVDVAWPAIWIDDRSAVDTSHPSLRGVGWEQPGLGTATNACSPADPMSASCGHGTEVASVALSQGVDAADCPTGLSCGPTDQSERGIAFGAGFALAPQFPANGCAYSALAWVVGITQGGSNGCDAVLQGAEHPATVSNESYAAPASGSTDLQLDAGRAEYGLLPVAAAGEFGPASGTVGSPCVGYDTLCVGGYDTGPDPSTASDDSIYSWSSRGPGPLGVKKPDLVAIGGSSVADPSYGYDKALWRYDTGTSLAAPQVAGGAILLAGSGVTNHLAEKAILIDSARLGRTTPGDPMGTQATWQPDWGWGALDLQAAVAQRTNYATDSVPPGSARFFRTTTQGAGDRATLTWDMRETGFCDWSGPGCPNSGTIHPLTNLDLAQRDGVSGGLEATSASLVDNVEQVRATTPGSTVYVVRAPSSIDGASAEPFAIAAKTPLTELAAPEPAITTAVSPRLAHDGDPVTIDATITNPSTDLAAEGASATIELPADVQLVTGGTTQQLGTLETPGQPGESATARWTVTGPRDAVARIRVVAIAHAYGEQVRSESDAGTITFDSTPPVANLSAPSGTTQTTSANLAWSASDGGSGIDHYEVQVATDGGPWTSWLDPTDDTTATWTGALGHTYAWRVRAIDRLANVSDWVASGALAMVDPNTNPDDISYTPPSSAGPEPVLTPTWPLSAAWAPQAQPRADGLVPCLRIDSALLRDGYLVVRGTLTPVGRVTASASFGRRTYTTVTRARNGRYTLRLRLGPHAPNKLVVRIRFAGDRRYAPEVLRRTIEQAPRR